MMGIDNYIDGGFTGEARRRYEDGLSSGRSTHRQSTHTPQQIAELDQVDREAATLRERLGLNQTLVET